MARLRPGGRRGRPRLLPGAHRRGARLSERLNDDELMAALVAFVERARSAMVEASVALDTWMRTGNPASELVSLLERDPAVAKVAGAGTIMRLAPHIGFAADTWSWVLGYVREALRPGVDGGEEAHRFLRFLRMERRTVPARVRATLFGLAVEEPVEFPFGRLLPGTAQDLAIADAPPTSRPPPCSSASSPPRPE